MGFLLILFILFVVGIGVTVACVAGLVDMAAESSNEKACVECAETIRKDARKCRHCGAVQPEATKAEPAAHPNRRLMEKAERLKDSPDFIALQASLRERNASADNRLVTVATLGVCAVGAASYFAGSEPRAIVVHTGIACAVALLVYKILAARLRERINRDYRAGVERLGVAPETSGSSVPLQ
jgi:hypothetical protein